ncbi:hypothetical protein WG66_006589 [Moniliophthora roreri]|nr:hypothetical protein WG66_006589 [Moniliophthora roreri]
MGHFEASPLFIRLLSPYTPRSTHHKLAVPPLLSSSPFAQLGGKPARDGTGKRDYHERDKQKQGRLWIIGWPQSKSEMEGRTFEISQCHIRGLLKH